MNILDLLEAEIYRAQDEWSEDDEDVVLMYGRETRRSKGSPINSYAVYYGLGLCGVESPRRWRSTFCTTDSKESMFLKIHDELKVRKVVVEDSRPCGWCEDDFNFVSGDHFNYYVEMARDRVSDMLEGLSVFPPDHENVEENVKYFKQLYQDIRDLMVITYTSDQGYEDFVKMVKDVDALCEKIDIHGYKGGNLTQMMQANAQRLLNANALGVAPAGQIPQGNYEVWFEGDYEAHKI